MNLIFAMLYIWVHREQDARIALASMNVTNRLVIPHEFDGLRMYVRAHNYLEDN